MNMKNTILLLSVIIISLSNIDAQNNRNNQIDSVSNSINIGPMGDIFILQYGKKISDKDVLIFGVSYTNPAILNVIQYPGTEQIYTLELGYRRYIWRGLHAEFQLDPQYFLCTDTVENKDYNGFGLTPELRFGYRFDFRIAKVPFHFNIQWFAGYHIINPKPKSFQVVDGGSFYFSPIPMFFFGIKF